MYYYSIKSKAGEFMRILLAEDDMKLGKLIQYMLQQKGHFVDWVTSGDMAYEYAMFDPYAVSYTHLDVYKRQGKYSGDGFSLSKSVS